MTSRAIDLHSSLDKLREIAGTPERFVVAHSGGLDSTVLLHALLAQTNRAQTPVLAVHINHQLQPQADAWQQHCADFAESLGVAFETRRVTVAGNDKRGPEAAARSARYAELQSLLKTGDWLLTAHHRDDQAETVLLNLLRGSGPAGTAGIPAARVLPPGWILRPMLASARADLLQYAVAHDLSWVEDASNELLSFDRNLIRHRVLPELLARWPDAAARLARSADLHREAATLLKEMASEDIAALPRSEQGKLSAAALLLLSRPRCRNLLRTAIADAGLAAVPARQLERIIDDVLPARPDASPEVRWRGGVVRRFRGHLYFDREEPKAHFDGVLSPASSLSLGHGMGRLELCRAPGVGLNPAIVERGLRPVRRQGGEKIRLPGQAHTRTIKKLLNSAGILPWMRDQIPLLYCGEDLVAVGDLWVDARALGNGEDEDGWQLNWHERPELF